MGTCVLFCVSPNVIGHDYHTGPHSSYKYLTQACTYFRSFSTSYVILNIADEYFLNKKTRKYELSELSNSTSDAIYFLYNLS